MESEALAINNKKQPSAHELSFKLPACSSTKHSDSVLSLLLSSLALYPNGHRWLCGLELAHANALVSGWIIIISLALSLSLFLFLRVSLTILPPP